MKIIVAGFLLFLSAAILPDRSFAQGEKAAADALRLEINTLVNVKRSIYREAPLPLNDTLSALAQKHSEDIASGKLPLGHAGFSERIALSYELLHYNGKAGENVTESIDAEEAVENWWTSEGHKANIIGDFNETGIGVARTKAGIWICTQIFISR